MNMRDQPLYADRQAAGRALVPLLSRFRKSDAVVFALPRGGVPVAIVIARALSLPLDLLHVRKIGAPLEPELALGAVVDGADPDIVLNEPLVERMGISPAMLDEIGQRELREIARRKTRYGAATGVTLMPTGRTAIVVDDGLATGATVRAAVQALRRRGATRVVVAVPVAPPDAVAGLEAAGAEVICPHVTEHFFGVGSFYRDFSQLSDESVIEQLGAFRRDTETTASGRKIST